MLKMMKNEHHHIYRAKTDILSRDINSKESVTIEKNSLFAVIDFKNVSIYINDKKNLLLTRIFAIYNSKVVSIDEVDVTYFAAKIS